MVYDIVDSYVRKIDSRKLIRLFRYVAIACYAFISYRLFQDLKEIAFIEVFQHNHLLIISMVFGLIAIMWGWRGKDQLPP